MGITKNHIHTEDQIELARLCKALGHPARIAIVEKLLTDEALNCNDLRAYIQLAQSTISEQIKQLHDVGILVVTVIGSNAFYEIQKIALQQISDYLEKTFKKMEMIPITRDKLLCYTRPLLYIASRNRINQT